MILLADGRKYTLQGAALVREGEFIALGSVKLGARPNSFPLAVDGIAPPLLYVELAINDAEPVLAAMSVMDYNRIVVGTTTRTVAATPAPRLMSQLANAVARRCGACGRR